MLNSTAPRSRPPKWLSPRITSETLGDEALAGRDSDAGLTGTRAGAAVGRREARVAQLAPLLRRFAMADTFETYRTVTAYLIVSDANAELAFLTASFGAVEKSCHRDDTG